MKNKVLMVLVILMVSTMLAIPAFAEDSKDGPKLLSKSEVISNYMTVLDVEYLVYLQFTEEAKVNQFDWFSGVWITAKEYDFGNVGYLELPSVLPYGDGEISPLGPEVKINYLDGYSEYNGENKLIKLSDAEYYGLRTDNERGKLTFMYKVPFLVEVVEYVEWYSTFGEWYNTLEEVCGC